MRAGSNVDGKAGPLLPQRVLALLGITCLALPRCPPRARPDLNRPSRSPEDEKEGHTDVMEQREMPGALPGTLHAL